MVEVPGATPIPPGSGGVALAQSHVVSARRATGCHYFPHWVTGLWLSLGILALLMTGACRRGVPVVDVGPKPPDARGTISGAVRGPEGTSPVVGREVQIINADTGERQTVKTGVTGGFTVQVPAGKYRLELPLKDGETLVKRPGIIDLNKSDVDAQIEFVLASVRVSRPRGPAYRVDNGLGSPIT
jgi:hypothetical protein